MLSQILEPLEEDLAFQNQAIKNRFDVLKDSCEIAAYQLNFLSFIKRRLYNEQQSFALGDRLNANPIKAIISIRLEQCVENIFRFLFTIYEDTTPYIISQYFDKIIFEINGIHKEWTRNADTLETDSIEIVLPNDISFPLEVSIILYPDFPVTYYQVPENLFPIVKMHQATLASVIRAVSSYALENDLIKDGVLHCDKGLGIKIDLNEIPLSQVALHIRSTLVPIQPMNLNVHLTPEISNHNFKVTLPNFSLIPRYVEDFHIEDIKTGVLQFAAQKELVESIAAVARNPIEAIEAEISGHCTQCELSDESNDNGPKVSISPANPARRSSVYYWQQWTSDHIARFLEENKMIHARYVKGK